MKGYNPITEIHTAPITSGHIISPDSFFLDALQMAFAKAGYKGLMNSDIKSVLKYVEKAILYLQFQFLSIMERTLRNTASDIFQNILNYSRKRFLNGF